jgi:phospho-N-acetylmuramoyl-pentapeptide-transferase
MIAVLGRYQIGQQVRTDGPQSHLKKAGTPTMGGLLISASIVISTLLWANLTVAAVWVALAGLVGFGAIGFWDDYTKVKHKRNLGLTARQKIMLQLLAAMLIGVLLLAMNASRQYSPDQRSILKGARRSADSRPAGQCLDLSAGVQFLRLRGVVLWGVERREPDGPGWARHRTDADAAGAMTALSFLSGNADLAKYSIWRAARRL